MHLLVLAAALLSSSVAEAQETMEAEEPFQADMEGEDATDLEAQSPAVVGGAGFRFGMSVEDARRACGRRLDRIRRGLFRCRRVLDLLPLEGSTVLSFRQGALVGVDVLIPLSTRTGARPPGTTAPSIAIAPSNPQWVSQYRSLRDLLTQRYGYSRPLTIAPDACLATEIALARCVAEDRAHVANHFTPSNGAQLTVHLVYVGDLGPHLRVRFFAPVE